MTQFALAAIKRAAVLGCVALAAGCQVDTPARPARPELPPARAQLFEGMGPHHRPIRTASAEAQRYFDQGLTWAYAFNHDEAIRCFTRATELDPGCAMAWWGIALASGPHINNPVMDEARSQAAWSAISKALALSAGTNDAERALIVALSKRYADPTRGPLPLAFEERAPLDRAYADHMALAYRDFPNDPDIGTLYAEALMDLRPWDLWSKDGAPRPETPRIMDVLEAAMAKHPTNPGAPHLYIHAVEASPHPEKANQAADRLRTLVPFSSHLVHMPAHIDVRTGRWAQAAEQNRRAARIDAEYRAVSPHQGFYRVYMAHNDHFLAYACMMLGRRDEALAAARAMIRNIPPDFLRENAAMIDGYTPIEIETLMRFGLWDEILQHPRPPSYLPITTCFWHFARASAYAATNKLPEADREQAAFRSAVATVPPDAIMAINPAHDVLKIADHVLAGEIAYRRGRIDEAVSRLATAAELEDQLLYMEPPDWIQPVRHALGAVLLSAGRIDEAERVYQDDLKRWPENGWSLFGLLQCQEARNAPEAAATRDRFNQAWRHADINLAATCLCVSRAD